MTTTLLSSVKNEYLKLRIISLGYQKSIDNAINNLGKYLGRPPAVGDHSDETLNRLASWMLDRKLSRPSVNRVRRTLCAFATFARREL